MITKNMHGSVNTFSEVNNIQIYNGILNESCEIINK